MKNEEHCAGHINGFQHLKETLGGLETEFDIGVKISEELSDPSCFKPTPGGRAFAEDRLVLYGSIAQKGSLQSRKVLRYGLTRAAYFPDLNSGCRMIVDLALPALENDLKLLKSGGEPESIRRIVMLRW